MYVYLYVYLHMHIYLYMYLHIYGRVSILEYKGDDVCIMFICMYLYV
jgi:hypothetical protein